MSKRSVLAAAAIASLHAGGACAMIGELRDADGLAAHVVMVLKREGARSSFCSGAVLARRIVLTGAHCVSDVADTRVHFVDAAGRPALLEPLQVARHPAFRADAVEKRRPSVDLALVETKEDLPFSFVPVALAEDAPAREGESVSIAGYGRREDGKTGRLAALTLVLRAPLSKLLMWLSAPVPPGGACDGDSGAPVFDSNGRLVGVVAFAEGERGRRCGKLTQAVRIAPQRAWIEQTIARWAR